MEIDVSKCPHFLSQEGAFKNHEYINNANACSLRSLGGCLYDACDGKCEWCELQQLKIAHDNVYNDREELKGEYNKLKAENDELKKQVKFKNQFRDYAHKYKNALDEIERMINDFCSDCIADCTGQDFCITYKTMRKLKEVKENE